MLNCFFLWASAFETWDDDFNTGNWRRYVITLCYGERTHCFTVSIVALQIAKAMHVTTIITSSSDEKLEICKSMGADHCINYRPDLNWSSEVLRITKGKGVDQVIKTTGQKTIIQSLKSLKWGGLTNDIGYMSGKGSDVEELGVSLMVIRETCYDARSYNRWKGRFAGSCELL